MTLIDQMRFVGFTIKAEGEAILISPAENLTEGDRDFIKANRDQILAELQAEAEVKVIETYEPTPREKTCLRMADDVQDEMGVKVCYLRGRPYKAVGLSEITKAYDPKARSAREHNIRCGVIYDDETEDEAKLRAESDEARGKHRSKSKAQLKSESESESILGGLTQEEIESEREPGPDFALSDDALTFDPKDFGDSLSVENEPRKSTVEPSLTMPTTMNEHTFERAQT